MNYPQGQQFPQNQPPQGPPPPAGGPNRNVVVLLIGAVALLLIVLLVVVIALVTKKDDAEPAATTVGAGATATTTKSVSKSVPAGAGLVISNRKHLNMAVFKEGATRTDAKLVITRSVTLPGRPASIADDTVMGHPSTSVFLKQRLDKSICVMLLPASGRQGGAIVKPDMTASAVDKEGTYLYDECTDFVDAVPDNGGGFYHVEGDGIPDEAKGADEGKVLVYRVKADAWDKTKVWAVMKGSPKLYEMRLEFA